MRNHAGPVLLQRGWNLFDSTVVVRDVICFNSAGMPTNHRYFITYSSTA